MCAPSLSFSALLDAADEGSVATSRGLAGDILPRKSLEASASALPVMHCTLEHR
jgi:hypothetical protein